MSTMNDSKLTKSVTKSIGRAKEKILQNLGKVDRTADEIFDEHLGNFNKQQYAATRLQKELNNYIRCIRACATANRSLMEAVSEIYEPEWGGKEILTINGQNCEMLWNDFAHRLAEQVLIPLNTYQGQFPEMRKKIEKRGRKLVDFDGERHGLQALQSNPRRAETKLAKQRESLESAKRTYEVLNSELHEELPGLYNSRIVFLVSAMSTLFASENIFHSESMKVYLDLEGVVERLAKESAKGKLNFKSSNAILHHSTGDLQKDGGADKTREENGDDEDENSSSSRTHLKTSAQVLKELKSNEVIEHETTTPPTNNETNKINETNNETNSSSKTNGGLMANSNGCHDSSESDGESLNKSTTLTGTISSTPNNDTPPLGSSTLNTPKLKNGIGKEEGTLKANMGEKEEKGVLYRVRATYRYQKEDVDELSFESGEVIRVIEYDDPEEQEEGWLMGIKENGEKGMFPANFTRPI